MNNLRELTLRGTILGAFITVIFTASNVYLGLKVGLTFSSAIPAAVISMAILRLFSGSTILENNMVQTQASAAGTLSSIIFVLPGLLMIGYWQSFPFWLTLAICAAGGMLGVLFSIPLRHVMVVKSNLPYPEGVAAAEILKAGSKTEGNDANDGLKDILFGGVVASLVSLFTNGFRILSDSTAYWFTAGKSIFQLPMGFSLALLSAGYLIGIMSGIAVLIGTIIAWLFGIPILSLISDYDSSQPLSQIAMGFWAKDIRFIGAGTIAIAAIWTLLTLIKPVIEGLKISFKTMRSDVSASDIAPMDQDLSPKTIFLIMAGMLMILLITFYAFIADSGLSLGVAWSLVICAVLFAFIMGFLVAAACGYMAGLVGSSASPISGIAIVAAIVISLILLGLGEINGMLDSIEGTNFATALALFTTSAVLAVACISNDNLQDLKTGYLVQATPWKQQVALLIGCIVGAIVIAPILEILYNAYGFTGAVPRPDMDQSQVLAAPQATLMTTIAKGIFSHNLDWTMILIGLAVGAVIIIIDLVLAANNSKFRLPALAVGLGIYLPPSITMPIFVGTVLSWIIKRNAYAKARTLKLNPEEEYKKIDRKAALIASGLIVGESLVGVILAVVIVISIASGGSDAPLAISADLGILPQYLGLLVFVAICILFIRRALSVLKR
ncbi:OPT family oligopeptide transporter [Gilliamella apicola]|uniref:Oligopeptide transporter, OPT family n=1 Tax=Gilliamella apicola TaxID=1196095 RepID=A0A242NDZ0_9GAMM|nr:oligopeptide transporter, OPT family [Gilliamella apicola]OTP81673.1 oligopeptide transporter, OPT family [Gilliamella apicola]OTP84224.1 oligopeptide transporter, OPT family [Gilliamella apicola]OTP97971.1 oligopeptide transporter, OPT family [Gilliamella apicola]OTQ09484.1 oligopeptide transporter, OPT family [Gilliamella apicola]OTQ15116.1 oligopeptide transporter, OPT family [Gilliamella apicola]